jgi:hypothetical protein
MMYLIHALRCPTKVQEDDSNGDHDRGRAGHRSPDLCEQAGEAPAGPARRLGNDGGGALRDPAGRVVGAGSPPLHDPGDRRAHRARARGQVAASDGPASGDPHRHRRGPGGGASRPAPEGRLAGPAAGRADRGRARDPAGGGTHPGEAEPVVTVRPPRAGSAAASSRARHTAAGRWPRGGCGPGAHGPRSTACPGSRPAPRRVR